MKWPAVNIVTRGTKKLGVSVIKIQYRVVKRKSYRWFIKRLANLDFLARLFLVLHSIIDKTKYMSFTYSEEKKKTATRHFVNHICNFLVHPVYIFIYSK